MDLTTNISLVVAAGAFCGVIFGYIGYLKGTKKDSYSAGTEKGTLKADVAYLVKCVDNLLVELRLANANHNALAVEVATVKEIAKSAHKRLDLIEEKG